MYGLLIIHFSKKQRVKRTPCWTAQESKGQLYLSVSRDILTVPIYNFAFYMQVVQYPCCFCACLCITDTEDHQLLRDNYRVLLIPLINDNKRHSWSQLNCQHETSEIRLNSKKIATRLQEKGNKELVSKYGELPRSCDLQCINTTAGKCAIFQTPDGAQAQNDTRSLLRRPAIGAAWIHRASVIGLICG